jgi:hypothetical protein
MIAFRWIIRTWLVNIMEQAKERVQSGFVVASDTRPTVLPNCIDTVSYIYMQ